jgi:hypothetical protein
LEEAKPFKQAGSNICVHGYRVLVKDRTLKRPTTLLKHARFLQNLEVVPVWPVEPEPVAQVPNEEEVEDE